MSSGFLILLYGIIMAALVLLIHWEFVQLRKGPSLEDLRRRLERRAETLRLTKGKAAAPQGASRWGTES